MRPTQIDAAKSRAPAIILISLAVSGLLLFFIAALVLTPAGETFGGMPSQILMGMGSLLLGLSVLGALAFVMLGFKRRQR